MLVGLRVNSPSQAISGGPLLSGAIELTGVSDYHYLRRFVE
jgi:hypothetical protein